MKKLAIFGMCLLLAVTAFGQFENSYQNDLGAITLANGDRLLIYDESGSVSGGTKMGYINYTDLLTNLNGILLMTGRATVDTNTVVADAAAATQSISLTSGDLLEVEGIYVEAGWHSSDFIEFNHADSNATTLDPVNIGAVSNSGTFDEVNFYFYATQDTVIYINLGDTVSVASTVDAFIIYTINR